MDVHQLTTAAELAVYNTWVRSHPEGSLWQSIPWKTYQEALGRTVRIYGAMSNPPHGSQITDHSYAATALVVIDRTKGGYATWEIPRGPLMNEEWKMNEETYEAFIGEILCEAKKEKSYALYLAGSSLFTFQSSLFTPSPRHIHPQATRVLNLTLTEDEILAQMHPKGRYNITRSEKHGVRVREGSVNDIRSFYDLLVSTGSRDGFQIAQKSHYERFLSNLDGSFILMAEYEGRPISGLLGVEWNGTAIYYYGASSYEHRSLMAPYLLQWEAIRRSKQHGMRRYDLLGISRDNAPKDDPWWGITDFKRKFGGTVVEYPQEQMVVLRPLVKRVLDVKRKLLG